MKVDLGEITTIEEVEIFNKLGIGIVVTDGKYIEPVNFETGQKSNVGESLVVTKLNF